MPEDHFKLVSRWYKQLDPQDTIDLSLPDGSDRELYVALDAWAQDGEVHDGAAISEGS